jgi:hypothetical protein
MWLGGTARVPIVAAALALHASIAAAQSNIGKAASVKNQVEDLLEGQQARHLSSGNAVHFSELIRSGACEWLSGPAYRRRKKS